MLKMQTDSIQVATILKDFHKEIHILKADQQNLLHRIKKSIEHAKLRKINETLGRKK